MSMLSFIFGIYVILSTVASFMFSLIFIKEKGDYVYFMNPKKYTRLHIILILIFLPSYIFVVIIFLLSIIISVVGESKIWEWLNQKAFRDKED